MQLLAVTQQAAAGAAGDQQSQHRHRAARHEEVTAEGHLGVAPAEDDDADVAVQQGVDGDAGIQAEGGKRTQRGGLSSETTN